MAKTFELDFPPTTDRVFASGSPWQYLSSNASGTIDQNVFFRSGVDPTHGPYIRHEVRPDGVNTVYRAEIKGNSSYDPSPVFGFVEGTNFAVRFRFRITELVMPLLVSSVSLFQIHHTGMVVPSPEFGLNVNQAGYLSGLSRSNQVPYVDRDLSVNLSQLGGFTLGAIEDFVLVFAIRGPDSADLANAQVKIIRNGVVRTDTRGIPTIVSEGTPPKEYLMFGPYVPQWNAGVQAPSNKVVVDTFEFTVGDTEADVYP